MKYHIAFFIVVYLLLCVVAVLNLSLVGLIAAVGVGWLSHQMQRQAEALDNTDEL